MKSYAETVDSGFVWIGRVPKHWKRSPLGSHFEERNETVSDADFPALSVTKDGVVPQLENVAKTINNDSRKLVRTGDFAINSRSDRKGSSGLSDLDGSVSVVYTVLRPKASIDGQFAHYLLRSPAFQEEFYRWGSGIVADLWSTRYSAMKRIQLALPPLDEQRTIADYLDRETARIDTLIEEQQCLIEMLRERHEVVVDVELAKRGFHAPTSLDGTGRYEVPDGWRVLLLGRALRQLTNGFVGPTRDILVENGIRYIQSTHIKAGRIDFDRRPFYVSREWHDERPRIHLQAGDVLIVQTGDIGKVAVVPPNFGDASCHALQIARARPELLSGEYLATFLSSRLGYHSLLAKATGALHPHLEAGIRTVPIVIPTSAVQAEIVRETAKQTAKIEILIADTMRFIELARERRAALITAAVTGQIDVREMA
jgi:type I restriction enzyme S subunit